MNFLFLTNSRFNDAPYQDASARYRCYNHAEDLSRMGFRADVSMVTDVNLQTLDRYDVLVYSRPRQSRQLDRLLAACHKNNCLTIADFDDLVFLPEYAQASPAVVNQQAGASRIRRMFSEHAHALKQFDAVSLATKELELHALSGYPSKPTIILPNGLSQYWLDSSPWHGKLSGPFRYITYLPGSRSHDQDFREIENALSRILQEHPDLVLQIVGSLAVNEQLFHQQQLVRNNWVDYLALPQIIADSFITIAPLANTVFNRCKSHIKFIESAAFGTPVIASDNPDIARHTIDGLFNATEPQQWSDAIGELKDPARYHACSQGLTDYARRECLNLSGVHQLLEFISQLQIADRHADIGTITRAS